ncbi:MAG TPA: sugar nucleotide-binding protein [Aggregatilineales bacterium]|nr:sugar nucleotide-binding protein [Aggregatilineales bacterium]
MRLLVTGGTGDLGREVCKQAAASGYEVIATYHAHPERLQPIPVKYAVKIDLAAANEIRSLLETCNPDAIIHTATTNTGPDIYGTIAAMARNLIAFTRPGVRLINLSSDVVFDGLHAPYGDDDPPSPVLPSDYARGKAEAERLFSQASGMLTIRTSLIYAFDRSNKQIAWMAKAIEAGAKVRLYVDEFRNPIWVENLAEAVIELAATKLAGTINVAGPVTLSRFELGRGLLSAMGYDPDHFAEPVSGAGTGRAPNLALDVSKAQKLLATRLLTLEEAAARSRGS